MLRPTLRCILLHTALLPLAVTPAVFGASLWPAWAGAVAAVWLATALDGLFTIPTSGIELDARAPEIINISDRERQLQLSISAPAARAPFRVRARVELDTNLEIAPDAFFTIPAGGAVVASFPLLALRRGDARLRSVWLQWSGPLGLVAREAAIYRNLKIGITPDTAAVRKAAIHYYNQNEFMSGLKVERFLGDGTEFESIREYTPGFDLRSLDWKASARHRKLLCREYRAERNHQVILAFDTGRLMGEPLDGVPRLDRAINAALLLSYVCLRTGDRVSTFAFDEKVQQFTEPAGGLASFPRIQRALSALDYSHAETNFTLALTDLSFHLRRRSLIIIFTDIVDSISAELMVENLTRLARRHLILFVTLSDMQVTRAANDEPADIPRLHRAVVATDLLRDRSLVFQKLRRLGVRCLDTPADQFDSELLNRYLDITRRELI